MHSGGKRIIHYAIYSQMIQENLCICLLSMRETEKAILNVHILTIAMGSRQRPCVVFPYLFHMPGIVARLKIHTGMMVHVCNLSTLET